jgi:hypothetical protein
VTWTKLSDDFSDDCYQLSDAAFRLHIEGLIWSNRKLLDLSLDKAMLPRWATRPEAAEELVRAGWWADKGDHYLIRHHGIYQRSRDEVLKQQQANHRNGKRGGRPRGPAREQASPFDSPPPENETESLSKETHGDRTGQDRTCNQAEGDLTGTSTNGVKPK